MKLGCVLMYIPTVLFRNKVSCQPEKKPLEKNLKSPLIVVDDILVSLVCVCVFGGDITRYCHKQSARICVALLVSIF